MKEYLLMAKGEKGIWNKKTQEDWEVVMKDFGNWIAGMKDKSLWIRGDALNFTRANIKKTENSKFLVDGPFVETKEAFSGFFLFKAESMNHAIELSKACPCLLHDDLELYELAGDRS